MSIVFLLLTSAAAGDEDLWLEVDAAAFEAGFRFRSHSRDPLSQGIP